MEVSLAMNTDLLKEKENKNDDEDKEESNTKREVVERSEGTWLET